MNRAFSLKFNYKCSPLCKWVYFSSLSVSFFFSLLLPFTSHVPCNPLCGSMSWIRNLWCDSSRWKKKENPAIPNTHLIFYTTKWLLFAERKRSREENMQGLQLSVSSDSPAFASKQELQLEALFLSDSPWPRDREDSLSTAFPTPPLILFPGVCWVWVPPTLSCGLVSQQPLYCGTAH